MSPERNGTSGGFFLFTGKPPKGNKRPRGCVMLHTAPRPLRITGKEKPERKDGTAGLGGCLRKDFWKTCSNALILLPALIIR